MKPAYVDDRTHDKETYMIGSSSRSPVQRCAIITSARLSVSDPSSAEDVDSACLSWKKRRKKRLNRSLLAPIVQMAERFHPRYHSYSMLGDWLNRVTGLRQRSNVIGCWRNPWLDLLRALLHTERCVIRECLGSSWKAILWWGYENNYHFVVILVG